MPSIIEGYTYDIFISYRQKDNKYDGWVTEFVENLKKELEATFKEEIGVYFDINPHDGLLETHDVDESLKEKLKCLVFIPIISRTYCDPKSFAWEHEFKAFVEQASNDQFGLKVKLPNGNVASRVLPVQIHDLDNEDITLCESVLGGVLRGIEFIYKEPGVNKPLTNDDDDRNNLNKTKYRIQINKVANSIKEIITGIKQFEEKPLEVSAYKAQAAPTKEKNNKIKLIAGSAIAIILIILGILFLPKLFKPSEELEKSIAVLPFALLSDEPDKQYLADGMMDAILLHLSQVGDLRVRSRTSTEQYRNTDKAIPEIGRELGVEYLLEGSFQKSGDDVRLIVQLLRASTDNHIWSNEYDRKWSDIFSVQSEVAKAVVKELKIIIKPEEKDLIEEIPTNNMQAYDYYLLGEHLRIQRTHENLLKAMDHYEKAIEADPEFIRAYTRLAKLYGLLAFYANMPPTEAYSSSYDLAIKALEFDSLFAEAYVIKGIVDLCYNFDYVSAEKNYKRALELEPNNLEAHASLAELMLYKGYFREALKVDQQAMAIDPLYPVRDGLYGVHLYYAGYKDSAIVHLSKLTERYPVCNFYLGIIYLREGKYEKAIESLQRTLSDFSPISITQLGLAYSKSGMMNETQRMLDTLETRAESEFIPYSMRGSLLNELGHKKDALEYLIKGYENREEFILLLMNIDTLSYSNVRTDPRFTEIIGKIRL